jgi:hypothetical protein
MKYLCAFTNRQTGERREVLVSLGNLNPDDRAFLERNRVTRPGAVPCIERTLAYSLARPRVPREFVYDIEAPDCCRRVN